MNRRTQIFGLSAIFALALVAAGCLVSGTFVVAEDFSFKLQSGLYYYSVDVTDKPDWREHKDNIDQIDAVGFDFWITSSASSPVTFSAWVDEHSGATAPSAVPSDAWPVIDKLVVNPGVNHFTYAQSQQYLLNVAKVKDLLKSGKLDFYGSVGGSDGSMFTIDSAKAIITVSASR